jgi:cell division protein FtsQ
VIEENINIELPEEQKPQHGKRVYVYFFLLVVVILSVFMVKAKWQKHVLVKQVVVEGISIVSKDEVVRLMKLPQRISMYDLDLTTLQKNILANSFVKKVVIKRDAPGVLRVVVEERVPSAMLVSNELYYIDNEGIVLPYVISSETYDTPVISGLDSLGMIRTGQKLYNQDVLEALEIIQAAKATSDEVFHTISEIRLRKGHDMILYSFETGVPIIFGKGDAGKKMVKLDTFWKQFLLNTDTNDIQYIDVRFDDQVVVSRKTHNET